MKYERVSDEQRALYRGAMSASLEVLNKAYHEVEEETWNYEVGFQAAILQLTEKLDIELHEELCEIMMDAEAKREEEDEWDWDEHMRRLKEFDFGVYRKLEPGMILKIVAGPFRNEHAKVVGMNYNDTLDKVEIIGWLCEENGDSINVPVPVTMPSGTLKFKEEEDI